MLKQKHAIVMKTGLLLPWTSLVNVFLHQHKTYYIQDVELMIRQKQLNWQIKYPHQSGTINSFVCSPSTVMGDLKQNFKKLESQPLYDVQCVI